ncbi:hypothetical protein [Streptomyces hypolithicus]
MAFVPRAAEQPHISRMTKTWLLLPALPLLPLLLIQRLLRRRGAGRWDGPGGGPPPWGVREPRRPSPSPPTAAAALTLT